MTDVTSLMMVTTVETTVETDNVNSDLNVTELMTDVNFLMMDLPTVETVETTKITNKVNVNTETIVTDNNVDSLTLTEPETTKKKEISNELKLVWKPNNNNYIIIQ